MLQLHDLRFVPFLSSEEIQQAIQKIARQVNRDLVGKTPVFLGVLNGAFLFAAELVRHYQGDCEVEFIKLKSYQGTTSTGKVKELIGVKDLQGKSVVVVEDIVDTGNTLSEIIGILQRHEVAEYKIATLLYKPEAYQKTHPIDYVGLEIPNKFVVGFGLDYNGLGRNLPEIYQLKEK